MLDNSRGSSELMKVSSFAKTNNDVGDETQSKISSINNSHIKYNQEEEKSPPNNQNSDDFSDISKGIKSENFT